MNNNHPLQFKKAIHKAKFKEKQIYQQFLKRLKKDNLTRDENKISHYCVYFLPFNPKTKKVFIGYHKKSGHWLSPGGHIDKNETPKQCLVRELKEELDVTVAKSNFTDPFLLTITRIDNPKVLCRVHFDIWYLFKTNKIDFNYDKREFARVKWLTLNKAQNLTTDRNTLKALSKLKQYS